MKEESNDIQTSILLIDCPDEKGLVHKISGVLLSHEYNMVGNSEFVDREANHFFMRTEVVGTFEIENLVEELRAILPESANIRVSHKGKKDIVILATKEYHCLGDLLLRHPRIFRYWRADYHFYFAAEVGLLFPGDPGGRGGGSGVGD